MNNTASQILHTFFHRLSLVRTFQNQANSRLKTGWNGSGNGKVSTSRNDKKILVFNEEGTWQTNGRDNLTFSNTYRWTLKDRSISLDHLRQGPHHPVFLVDLIPEENILQSNRPHICEKDEYSATLAMVGKNLSLIWKVVGPKKNEETEYLYITEPS